MEGVLLTQHVHVQNMQMVISIAPPYTLTTDDVTVLPRAVHIRHGRGPCAATRHATQDDGHLGCACEAAAAPGCTCCVAVDTGIALSTRNARVRMYDEEKTSIHVWAAHAGPSHAGHASSIALVDLPPPQCRILRCRACFHTILGQQAPQEPNSNDSGGVEVLPLPSEHWEELLGLMICHDERYDALRNVDQRPQPTRMVYGTAQVHVHADALAPGAVIMEEVKEEEHEHDHDHEHERTVPQNSDGNRSTDGADTGRKVLRVRGSSRWLSSAHHHHAHAHQHDHEEDHEEDGDEDNADHGKAGPDKTSTENGGGVEQEEEHAHAQEQGRKQEQGHQEEEEEEEEEDGAGAGNSDQGEEEQGSVRVVRCARCFQALGRAHSPTVLRLDRHRLAAAPELHDESTDGGNKEVKVEVDDVDVEVALGLGGVAAADPGIDCATLPLVTALRLKELSDAHSTYRFLVHDEAHVPVVMVRLISWDALVAASFAEPMRLRRAMHVAFTTVEGHEDDAEYWINDDRVDNLGMPREDCADLVAYLRRIHQALPPAVRCLGSDHVAILPLSV